MSDKKKKQPVKPLIPTHGMSLDEGETFISLDTLKKLAAKEKSPGK